MEEVSRTTTRNNNGLWHCCCLAAAVLVAATVLGSCSGSESEYSNFTQTAEAGWPRSAPIYFTPVYPDSARVYDLYVAIRHNSEYNFGTLDLAIDIIAPTGRAERRVLSIGFADESGNWTGSGFGAMYQHKVPVRRGVTVSDLQKLAIWHSMPSDTLTGITEIGIVME